MQGQQEDQARSLVVIGAGGFGSEVLWIAEAMNAEALRRHVPVPWRIFGFADADPTKRGSVYGKYLVHGDIAQTALLLSDPTIYFVVAIGNNHARKRMACDAETLGWHGAQLIHPTALVADSAQLSPGVVLAAGCVVAPNAEIGPYNILNFGTSVGHDSVLEGYSLISPGARITGGCRVESFVLLGPNASLLPCVTVGRDAVVGANSCALTDVAAGATVMGCPAQTLWKQSHTEAIVEPQPHPA